MAEDKKISKKVEKKDAKKLEDYKTMGEGAKKDVVKEDEKKDEKVEGKKDIKENVKSAVEKVKGAKSGKTKGPKAILEREYIVPLRKKVNKVQRYKRAKKAVKVLKEFIAKHMKVEERDLKKVKIDRFLNNELWFRGIKKPVGKIKVKAVKYDDGIVKVELVDIPDKVKFDIDREKKRQEKVKPTKKKVEKKEEETEEEKKDEEEKEKASVEAGLKEQKVVAKEMKHTSKGSHKATTAPVRKALKK